MLWHSRTSALSHLADTALPTPARSHTGSHWPTAPCVPRCTTSAFCVVPLCLVLCTTLHCVCPAALLLTAWAQWAVDLLQCTAPLPGRSGQWTSCNTLPHCRGAVGSGPPSMHCPTAWGQWAVQLLQCTASLPWGSGQCNSCNTVPHCLGAVGSRTPAMHCLTAPGAVGSGPPAMLCTPAWGDGESSPGGGRSILQGPWGGGIVVEPGTPARGVQGVLPRGWSDYQRAGGREGWIGSRACFRAGGGEGGRVGILRRAVLCCAVSCFAVLWGVLRCVVCCAVLVPRELRLGYGLVFELEGLRGVEGWFALCAGLRAG